MELTLGDGIGRVHDITGKTFGRWTVLAFAGRNHRGLAHFTCRCQCGTLLPVAASNLRSGISKSCGCLKRERITTHGLCPRGGRMPEYQAWSNMLERCRNKNLPNYRRYGGRGIKVCERWLSFQNFLEDMGRRPSPKHSIERINNDLGYFKENCKWATRVEQCRNMRSNTIMEFNGESRCVAEWAEVYGLSREIVWSRLLRGWTLERALTTPRIPRKRK